MRQVLIDRTSRIDPIDLCAISPAPSASRVLACDCSLDSGVVSLVSSSARVVYAALAGDLAVAAAKFGASALSGSTAMLTEAIHSLVDGDHYFDTIADDAEFEFRYIFPGWPQTLNGREALMALYAGYGNNIVPHGADALVIHRSQDPRVVIIEYQVHGKIVATGASYDNRFISVVTIEDRKIVRWRDYLDSLAAMTALSQASTGAGKSK